MSYKFDFQKIKEDALANALSLVPNWLPGGKRKGPHWVVKNPMRPDASEGSFSVNLYKGVWKDFACGDGGPSLLDLFCYLNGLDPKRNEDLKKGAEELNHILGGELPEPVKGGQFKSDWEPTGKLPPREATAQDMTFDKLGRLVKWWAYRDAENRVIGYVCRFEDEQGKKQTIPLNWCKNSEGKEQWRFKGFADPRPLFNQNSIASLEKVPVLIVEGEKCAEAAALLIGNKIPVTTWIGGTNAVSKTNWEPLRGRTVIIWPDADKPGVKAASEIGRILREMDCKVDLIVPPTGSPKGWDCADFITEKTKNKEFWAFIQSRKKKPKIWSKEMKNQFEEDLQRPPENDAPPVDDDFRDYGQEDFGIPEEMGEPPADNLDETEVEPFRCLGHNRENFYYLPKKKGQITSLTAASHNEANLVVLAMRHYWETEFPGKQGVSWRQAAERLIWMNYNEGIFTPDRVRGRGAWNDGEDLVIHRGDVAIVNGKEIDPVEYRGKYIYERAQALHNPAQEMASKDDGIKVLELCKMFPWKSDVYGVLMAGWAYLAPICGALYWRSHIWITGEAGTGKTWIRDNVIRNFLSGFGVVTQGESTSSGIRQWMSKDALPVMFDEAESNDRKGAERIAGVLELMRQSSMPGEAIILKGSAGGDANSYMSNSSFCLMSIVSAIRLQADEGRISTLELLPWSKEMEERKGRTFKEHKGISAALCSELFTPERSQMFRNRAFKNLKTIKKNVETFREVFAEHIGNQRDGDQIGTLLAGAFCLASDGIASREAVKRFIKAQDWSEQTGQGFGEKDQEAILRTLLQYVVSIQTKEGRLEFTVEQLIRAGILNKEGGPNETGDPWINPKDAKEALNRIGIKVSRHGDEVQRFFVEPKHTGLDRLFKDTPWSTGYAKIFLRVDGAQSVPRRVTTVSGEKINKRVVQIPAGFICDVIKDEHPEREQEIKTEPNFNEQEGEEDFGDPSIF